MSLVLIGAPGSGKSTVGPELAERLGMSFVDVDQLIEIGTSRQIAEIFATDGEAAFRELEREATLSVLAEPGERVVALGGGAVMNEAIAAALAHHQVIWLQVSAATAAERVGLNAARPLLIGNVRGRLIALLNERKPTYQQLATIMIDTNDHDYRDVVDLITVKLAP